MSKPVEVPIEKVVPSPYQPRLEFDLEDLKGSIMKDGILVPITVRMVDGNYELIDGERRTRLAKELGMKTIPATLIDVDDTTARRMVWKVNTLRKDYKPEEKAKYFKKLQDEGMSIKGIARECDYSRRGIRAHLNVLKLPEKYQKLIWSESGLSVAHVQELEVLLNEGADAHLSLNNIISKLDLILDRKLTSKELREVLRPELKEIEERRVESAQKAVETVVPEMKIPESPDDLRKAAEVLKREARRKEEAQKTPEQLEAERQKSERRKAEIAERRRLKAEADKKAREERDAERKRLEKERKQLAEERKKLEAEAAVKLAEERKKLDVEVAVKLAEERKKLDVEAEAKLAEERKNLEAETRQKFEEEKKKLEEAAKASIAVLNLPPEIMELTKTFGPEEVSPKAMTPQKARLLVPIERSKQLELAKRITERGMTTSQIKSAIRKADEIERIISNVKRESLREKLQKKYEGRLFDADVKPEDIKTEINLELGKPTGPSVMEKWQAVQRTIKDAQRPYMDNSFVREWRMTDRRFIQLTTWMDEGDDIGFLVREDHEEHEFKDFDEADKFAQDAGGYCTGLVTIKKKKYWCIYVSGKST